MKRSCLTLLALVLFAFCSSSWAQCPEDPNDRGNCDTLHVTCLDCEQTPGTGPWHVRFPLLITHDQTVPDDSIVGFVIPLAWTRTNPTKYCSLSLWWNTTSTLWAYPDFSTRSVFRHILNPLDPTDTLMHNRMAQMAADFTMRDWDTRIVDVSTDSAWARMSIVATGTEDQKWWEGERVLLATWTFVIEDTMTLCLDTTLWPPMGHLLWSRRDALTYTPRDNLPKCFLVGPEPQPDFTLTLDPDSLEIQAGTSDSTNVIVTSLHGFASTCTLKVTYLPPEASGSFDPDTLTPTGTSNLQINTAVSTPVGIYTPRVIASEMDKGIVDTAELTLIVTPPPGFTIEIEPDTLEVQAGNAVNCDVILESLFGFSSTCTLTISGLPADASGSFDPRLVIPPDTSNLHINTAVTTPAGVYTALVIAAEMAKGIVDTAELVLNVTSASEFTAGFYDVDFARVSANTADQPIIGFQIPCGTNDTLRTLALKSYMERAFSVKLIKLWAETNQSVGWQSTDTHLKTYTVGGNPFETQDTIVMNNIDHVIRTCGADTRDTFYVTVDCHTDSVNAKPEYYHDYGLEVVIEPEYIHLGETSSLTNINRIANPGYVPGTPPWFDYFKLMFDTQGPPIVMNWCFALDGCKADTIDLQDSVCILADTSAFADEGDAIDGYVTLDLSAFGLSSSFKIKPFTDFGDDCFGAGTGWDTCFLIPDVHIPNCIDVDSGHVIYALAEDSAGNETTAPLYFNKPIDTCKPNIDSITFRICYDANGDGIAAIGDSLEIIGWGLSNADFEVDSMIANLTAYHVYAPPSLQFCQLDDVTNNNRLFRKRLLLEWQWGAVELAADSSENRITVWAWDNACNYDTAQKMLNARVDTRRPSFSECYYWYHWDANDTLDCIGLADSVKIGANLTGSDDLASVCADLVDGGIGGLACEPLAQKNGGIFELLWEVGEPPVEDGKDANNTDPPPIDADYSVLITAIDSAGNWDTCRTAPLNRTLDSRCPRWTNQEKMYIKQMPGAKIAIYWPTSDDPGPPAPSNSCNERDAAFFHIYVDSGDGYGSTPLGATFDNEYMADTNMWISEVLTDGKFYKFKIKQQDDCGNLSDFSNEMGALADYTPGLRVMSITDVGNDQGKQVRVKWHRCYYDTVGSPVTITEYSIWRRIDEDKGHNQNKEISSSNLEMFDGGRLYPPGDWDFIKTVPAIGEVEYNTVCPTLGDSTLAEGMYWSVFFVIAHTEEPLIHYDSDPDSGYSLDNIPPLPIRDLQIDPNSWFTLQWTVPGEYEEEQPISAYDIRYSTVPVGADTQAWWDTAQACSGEGFFNLTVGEKDSFRVAGETGCHPEIYFAIKGLDDRPNSSGISNVVHFLCGDDNGDGIVNVGDVVYEVCYLFRNGPAPSPRAAGDVNCDGIENLGDIVYKVSYLYRSGRPPCDQY